MRGFQFPKVSKQHTCVYATDCTPQLLVKGTDFTKYLNQKTPLPLDYAKLMDLVQNFSS